MSFEVNTLTAAGAALLSQAATNKQIQFSGCDAVETAYTTDTALEIVTFTPSNVATQKINYYLNTNGTVSIEAAFNVSKLSSKYYSLILYGKFTTDTAYTPIAVLSSFEPFFDGDSINIADSLTVRFTLNFSPSENVIAVPDSTATVTQGQFEKLQTQVLGKGTNEIGAVGELANRSAVHVYDNFLDAQCYAADDEQFIIRGSKTNAVFYVKTPSFLSDYDGLDYTRSLDLRMGIADVRNNLVIVYFVVRAAPNLYWDVWFAVYDLTKSVKFPFDVEVLDCERYMLTDPIIETRAETDLRDEMEQGANDRLIQYPKIVEINNCLFVFYASRDPGTVYRANPASLYGQLSFSITNGCSLISIYTQQTGTNITFTKGWFYGLVLTTSQTDKTRFVPLFDDYFLSTGTNGYFVADSASCNGDVVEIVANASDDNFKFKVVTILTASDGIAPDLTESSSMSFSGHEYQTSLMNKYGHAGGAGGVFSVERTTLEDGSKLACVLFSDVTSSCYFPLLISKTKDAKWAVNYIPQYIGSIDNTELKESTNRFYAVSQLPMVAPVVGGLYYACKSYNGGILENAQDVVLLTSVSGWSYNTPTFGTTSTLGNIQYFPESPSPNTGVLVLDTKYSSIPAFICSGIYEQINSPCFDMLRGLNLYAMPGKYGLLADTTNDALGMLELVFDSQNAKAIETADKTTVLSVIQTPRIYTKKLGKI